MPNIFPWFPLSIVPAALVYVHFTNPHDPSFGPKWYQSLVDSFSIPFSSHGGSVWRCALFLLLPYASTLLLYATASGKHAMNAQVKMEGALKTCLRFHALVCIGYSIGMELFPAILAKSLGCEVFASDANTFVLKTALADLFFVLATGLWLMSKQEHVPRWATWIPLVQTIYNFTNDIRWVQEANLGGPVIPYRLIVVDGGVFGSLLVSYLYTQVYAVYVETDKKRN